MCVIGFSVGESGLLKHCLLHYLVIISTSDTVTKQCITPFALVLEGFNNIRVMNITYHENYWLNIHCWLPFTATFTLLNKFFPLGMHFSTQENNLEFLRRRPPHKEWRTETADSHC
jgi:hypothetical protein